MGERCRVLVVDDSAYLRKVVSHMLAQSPLLEVVGTARDGQDALQKVVELEPDVVTLDLNMAGMDGVEFIRAQMARSPVAVVVVSIASEDGRLAAEAIEAGAVEFVRKPTGLASEKLLEIQQDLVEKVLAAARIPREKLLYAPRRAAPPLVMPSFPRVGAVVLGLSTGGPQALRYLLAQLPANFPVPLAAVLHMPVGYTGPFAKKLNAAAALEVLEASPALEMKAGRLILGRAGSHLRLRRHGSLVRCFLARTPEGPHLPSVDVLFESASEAYGSGVIAAVFTGMGTDGTAGAAWVKARGGSVLAEAESSCVVYGMPRSVAEAGLADECPPLADMLAAITARL